MKSRRNQKSSEPLDYTAAGDGILIRHCHGIPEFEACVRVERDVWKSSDIDVVPIPLFVVASETGGQVLGAFQDQELIGFTMAIAGWRNKKPFLHSHMTAVLDAQRVRKVQLRIREEFLKWFAKGYAATAVLPGLNGMDYIVERWSKA